MMKPVLLAFLIADFIFLATGVMLVAAATIWRNEKSSPPTLESVGRLILLEGCPLVAVLANGILAMATFLVSLPAFALPTSRTWLKIHSWGVVLCLVFTLVLGLNEWMQTLTTRASLGMQWGRQSNATQSMLQQKFDCCGYVNYTSPLYVPDAVCTNDIVAASKEGCVTAFSGYGEKWLNYLFTAAFGVVGMDVVLLLCAAMLIKYRKEQLRYRLIDQKWGVGNI
ncbi:hypothetical protein FPQ18DRAFT_364743 [Pyronema domesticum]|uniref:Similar to CD63 antigen acc. no. P08962 n=1 Tax=Pyronema omphalodes (strain CBS 100304) TaxID=1076935 RepID=U4LF83_PYROM|nr:hypothetical protein FPQ18DRAFT_364743 [Pyronema domesticum]CCX30528.1 Similar to CD63 antigen; acc. no. P08962 [Pyronema omphalodes CBS 100304]